MAVVHYKSAEVTNLDAAPPVRNLVTMTGGRVRRAGGTVEVANGDSAGSTIRFARLPSIAIIDFIWLATDALGGTCAMDIGVYETTPNGGAVVDADEFASAVAVSSAVALTNVRYEAVATDIANVNKRLWEQLGIAADPNKDYDIAATLTAATAAAGTVTLLVQYVVD
jgi:hypothetical protein